MTEWILAYSKDCASCADIGDRVREVAGDRVEVMPLTDERVVSLRQRAFGVNAPWAPTLLMVDGDAVKGWTGFGLSVRLSRLLGMQRSIRVVRDLRQADALMPVNCERRRLLRAVPAVTVGAFLLTGGLATPARAAKESERRRVEAWMAAHRDALPQTYDGVVAHPMAYRRAILNELPDKVKAQLWQEHIQRYRNAHSDLTSQQLAALNSAAAATEIAYLKNGRSDDRVRAAEEAVRKAFEPDEATKILAILGPPDASTESSPKSRNELKDFCTGNCNCSVESDWCSNRCLSCPTGAGSCWNRSTSGCGTFALYPCDGIC